MVAVKFSIEQREKKKVENKNIFKEQVWSVQCLFYWVVWQVLPQILLPFTYVSFETFSYLISKK